MVVNTHRADTRKNSQPEFQPAGEGRYFVIVQRPGELPLANGFYQRTYRLYEFDYGCAFGLSCMASVKHTKKDEGLLHQFSLICKDELDGFRQTLCVLNGAACHQRP